MTNTEPEERGLKWLGAVKGLTISNVLIIALLACIAVPVYVIYRALDDEKLLDRLMSSFEEIHSNSGCAVRHVKERNGPEMWGISSGFAFQGADRWFVNVVVSAKPTEDQIATYCESLKLIADRMLERGGQVHQGPVQGTKTDRSGHPGDLPAGQD